MPFLKNTLFAILAFLLGGCSSFGTDWKEAAVSTPATEFSLEGAWEGKWLSSASGHSGPLRCVIREEPDSDVIPEETDSDRFRARYHARWGPLFTFEYTLPMEAHREGPLHYTLEGEADLGWPWGNYRYRGEVVGERFSAKYWTELDHGSFEMTRADSEGAEVEGTTGPESASAEPAVPPAAQGPRNDASRGGREVATAEKAKRGE